MIIGSSNYGRRSAVRDIEANVLVTTTDPALRLAMADEVNRIRSWSVEVDERTFQRPDRRVALGVKVAAWCIQDMF